MSRTSPADAGKAETRVEPGGVGEGRFGPDAEGRVIDPVERNSRQEKLAPLEKLTGASCVVIGVGAVGRAVALQLAQMGVGSIEVFDHDRVDVPNLSPQGYRPDQLGESKALATAADCRRVRGGDDHSWVHARPVRFAKSDWKSLAGRWVFACADDMAVRRTVWEASVKAGAVWMGDARVAGETVRVLSVAAPEWDKYEGTLFDQSQAYQGECATRMAAYGAVTAAGLLVCKFAQRLRGNPVGFTDHTLNLLAWDLF